MGKSREEMFIGVNKAMNGQGSDILNAFTNYFEKNDTDKTEDLLIVFFYILSEPLYLK